MEVRILIVDDHPTVRESLRFVFAAAAIEQIMEATTCGEALDTLRNRRVDVVLLDIMLRHENGLDALQQIKAIDPDAAVLVHSYSDNPRLLSRSFHGGAAGYVVKGEDKNALIQAVRNAAAGGSVWTAEQRILIRELDAELREVATTSSAVWGADIKV